MKKRLFYFLLFSVLLLLLLACTVQLNTLHQKTIKKCSACELFLKEDKIYNATYREYDAGVPHFYSSIEDLKAPNKFKVKRKANFMDYNDWQHVLKHTFCFNGMKRAEVESKFGKSLDKYSGEWETAYNFKVGAFNRDSAICLIFGNIHFYYEIINGDTLYRQMPNDMYNFKKCLDADGVRYKE